MPITHFRLIFNFLDELATVQGQKSWKHDFEIKGDPKGPPNGSTHMGTCGAAPLFRVQNLKSKEPGFINTNRR